MKVIRSISRMQAESARLAGAGREVVFVPTMGALHDGHAGLIRAARGVKRVVVVSIFVNPTQFGPGEDYRSYPRTLGRDKKVLREAGADVLFLPTVAAMYPAGMRTTVRAGALGRGLCGRHRPGHFDGVATVVTKLFSIVQPAVAVFGRKDYQQAKIIQRLVRDRGLGVRICLHPTVRDTDGLALSSRNRYLSADQRRQALSLHEALRTARHVANSRRDAAVVTGMARKVLRGAGVRVDYVQAVHPETLRPVRRIAKGTVLAIAAHVGKARLIDNEVLR